MKAQLSILTFALTPSVLPAQQAHYPLSIGTIWEYDQATVWYQAVHVLKDTVMSNGTTYAFIEYSAYYSDSQRHVGDKVYRFNSYTSQEEVLFDFSKASGDTVAVVYDGSDTTDILVQQVASAYLFGRMRRIWRFAFNQRHIVDGDREIEVTDSIGITFVATTYGFQRVQRAWIDGKAYVATVVEDGIAGSRPSFRLHQNYPNPFNPNTTIVFELPTSGQPLLRIFSLLGSEVSRIDVGYRDRGTHTIRFAARGLSSGIYFYRLEMGGWSETRKFVLTK